MRNNRYAKETVTAKYVGQQALLEKAQSYMTPDEVSLINHAYVFAQQAHGGKKRESGEPYFNHVVIVANTLLKMHQDVYTVCAGLLHDVIEDTPTSKEELARLFGPEVANLVEGVSKQGKDQFTNLLDYRNAYASKIVTGVVTDIRIIIIKLADRLHNMNTLQYKKKKQRIAEISLETLQVYGYIAKIIGAYRIKYELEDLCLEHLLPEVYRIINGERYIEKQALVEVKEEFVKAFQLVRDPFVKHITIRPKIKNSYGIYKEGFETDGMPTLKRIYDPLNLERIKLEEIDDLRQLKIVVDTVAECYKTYDILCHLKEISKSWNRTLAVYPEIFEYEVLPETVTDYIQNEKKNRYQSLDFNMKDPKGRLYQVQIRTRQMQTKNSYGYMYDTKKEMIMGNQFIKRMEQMIEQSENNQQIIDQFLRMASNRVRVQIDGSSVEVEPESTVGDLKVLYHIDEIHVNGELVPDEYQFLENDIVELAPISRPTFAYRKKMGLR